ncbi:MAG TPA: SRPBCC family protein [Pseudonocardiaceae bacterium]
MRRKSFDIRVHTPADITTVYALLCDGATWPTWSPIESFELERAGDQAPEGRGAIRIFRKGRVAGRDEIVELVPDRRFSYRHLSGLPVRDYRGDIDLEPDLGGTGIRWRVSFLPKVPGTGWLWRWGVKRMISQAAAGLAAHAATLPGRTSPAATADLNEEPV